MRHTYLTTKAAVLLFCWLTIFTAQAETLVVEKLPASLSVEAFTGSSQNIPVKGYLNLVNSNGEYYSAIALRFTLPLNCNMAALTSAKLHLTRNATLKPSDGSTLRVMQMTRWFADAEIIRDFGSNGKSKKYYLGTGTPSYFDNYYCKNGISFGSVSQNKNSSREIEVDLTTALRTQGMFAEGALLDMAVEISSSNKIYLYQIDSNNEPYLSLEFEVKDESLTSTANLEGYKCYYNTGFNRVTDAHTLAYVAQQKAGEDVVKLNALPGGLIPAGTPVILRTENDGYQMSLAATADAATAVTGNLLFATTEETALENVYRLGYREGEGNGLGFYLFSGTVPAGTVYLKLPASSLHIEMGSDSDFETSIEALPAEEPATGTYNLQGHQTTSQHGICICNHKLVWRP